MRSTEGRQNLAIPMGAIAVCAWGFGPLFVRGVDASATTIVFWRLWMAAPVMVTVARLTGGRVTLPLLKTVFVPGVLFGISTICSFTSYQWTSIANATLIGALQPVLMLVIGPLLFGDRTAGRQILFAVIALGGIATVVLGAHGSSGASLHGDLIALLNLGIWTTYFVRVKQVRNKGIHSAALIAGIFCVAAVVVTPFALLTSRDLGAIHGTDWLLILAMVLVPGLIGHGFMTWAQRHLDITLSSLLTLGNPVISAIGAWMIFGQALGAVQIAGAIVVLAALGGIVLEARANAALTVTSLSISTAD
ncbi:MAG: DMT family transporter [Ilumatobacteraceae bacterium]